MINTLTYFIIILLIFTIIGIIAFYDISRTIKDIHNKLDVLKSKAISCDNCDAIKIWNEVNDITKGCLSKSIKDKVRKIEDILLKKIII